MALTVTFTHPAGGAPREASFGPYQLVEVKTPLLTGVDDREHVFVASLVGRDPRNLLWKTPRGLYHAFRITNGGPQS